MIEMTTGWQKHRGTTAFIYNFWPTIIEDYARNTLKVHV